jgi:hypothetical protein
MILSKVDVVNWLKSLTDKQFFETVYEAAQGRGADGYDTEWLDSHVVVGRASREKAELSGWWIELVGLPSSTDPWPDDEVVAQRGSHCGVGVVSWAKHFKCPVCGETTYGT